MEYNNCLFLILHGSSFFGLLLASSSNTSQTSVGTFNSHRLEHIDFLLLFCDHSCLVGRFAHNDWHDLPLELSTNSQFRSFRITSFGCTDLLGEDDQFAFVFLQSLHVGLETFSSLVLSSVVNTYSDGGCVLLWDTSCFEFFQSETTSHSHLGVVFVRRAPYDRPQRTSNRSWCNRQRLLLTSNSSALLTARLVEPCFDTVLPVLFEMGIG